MDEIKKISRRISAACKSLGTYREEFDPIITRLAELSLRRDRALADYEKSGGRAIIKQKNKNGAEYLTKNPFLAEVDNVLKMMLELERELGLTPAALKRINEEKLANEKPDPFAALAFPVRRSG